MFIIAKAVFYTIVNNLHSSVYVRMRVCGNASSHVDAAEDECFSCFITEPLTGG